MRTTTRSHETETGPSTSGAVGSGEFTDFATLPQIRCSAFCITIQAPIMISIVVSMSASRFGRISVNSMIAPSAMPAAIANTIDTKKFMPSTTAEQLDAKWKTWYKAPKKEEHSPVLSAKVQKTGGRPTRFYEAVCVDDKTARRKMSDEELEKVNWKSARVAMIVEIRSVWLQQHQLGLTITATEVLIHPDDDTSGFDSEESD